MSKPPAQRLRKFRFNFPQRVAALLLLCFLAQCLWLNIHTPLTRTGYRVAVCGTQMWSSSAADHPDSLACSEVHDGTLAYRLAGLPVALDHLITGRVRTDQQGLAPLAFWIRLPFLFAGLALGGCLWWVTRRLFGNPGGYIALTLYCFTPPILKYSVVPNNEILAAYGFFAALYTAIGVAHALQGPRRKWRKRILLLTLTLGFTAAAHIAAFLLAIIISTPLLLWLSEERRKYVPVLACLWTGGALLLLFASVGFTPAAFAQVFTAEALRPALAWMLVTNHFVHTSTLPLLIALVLALVLYGICRRSRYFGNTTPLALMLLLALLALPGIAASPWLWAIPFLLTFLGGIYADALETRGRRLFLIVCGGLLAAQAILCLVSLPALISSSF